MVVPQKNVPADKRLETVEENLGKILDEQQQQKLVNQQQARAIEDNKIMQNEMMRKLDALLGKLEKRERGKGNETPNLGILTPEFNSRDKNSGQGSSGDDGAGGPGGGGPGLIFGSFDGTNQGRGRFEYKHRKVDMPTFDGTDPDGWIL